MADAQPQKQTPVRRLFISVMLHGFVALVVFVVGTYYFVIPRLYDQQHRIDRLEAALVEHQSAHEEAAAEEEAAPTETAEVVPAAAPAAAEVVPAAAPAEAAPAAAPAIAPAQ